MRIHVAVRTFLFLGLLAVPPASAQDYHWDSYDPPVVSWGPDRLDVFQICADGHVWHTAFNGVGWQTAWDDRGGPEAPLIPGALSVVSWGPNRIDVFIGGEHPIGPDCLLPLLDGVREIFGSYARRNSHAPLGSFGLLLGSRRGQLVRLTRK